jgi:ABC-type antimicrobial peptide transport system permease subunit
VRVRLRSEGFKSGKAAYGVISYAVSRRTREIEIRVALGVKRGDVARLVLAEGFRLLWVGILVGVVTALGVARAMSCSMV